MFQVSFYAREDLLQIEKYAGCIRFIEAEGEGAPSTTVFYMQRAYVLSGRSRILWVCAKDRNSKVLA